MVQVPMEENAYDLLEPGWYPATLANIEAGTGPFGPLFKFTFSLQGAEGETTDITGLCGQKLAPGTKLEKWLTGLGLDVEVGENVELDDFVGRKCRVFVDTNETEKNGEKRAYSNVMKVALPKTKTAGSSTKKMRPPAAEEEEEAPAPKPPKAAKKKPKPAPEPESEEPEESASAAPSGDDDIPF